jgi:hypothetical protein
MSGPSCFRCLGSVRSVDSIEEPKGDDAMKKILSVIAAGVMLAVLVATPVGAATTGAERQPVLREWSDDGMAGNGDVIGWTNLVRKSSGISGTTHVSGLRPDGVYTFWIVGVDPAFLPMMTDLSKIYVDKGNAAVVGRNGRATVHWSAATGAASIVTPVGPLFGTLDDPEGRIVRIEIAYHGQVPEDGVVPAGWLDNFWEGDQSDVCSAMPFMAPGPIIAGQPHCPVFFASTHAPG